VTVTGKSSGGKHSAEVIRWRLPSKQELIEQAQATKTADAAKAAEEKKQEGKK
jgi:hypothetical protein